MVFQGEDTALTEDIFKDPPKFINTRAEWAADNRLQIFNSKTALAGATEDLFAVPAKNTLFITACRLASKSTGAAAEAALWITPGIDDGVTFLCELIFAANLHDSMSLSFPMPIKVEEGSIIQVDSTNSISKAQIFGFIVPKRIT